MHSFFKEKQNYTKLSPIKGGPSKGTLNTYKSVSHTLNSPLLSLSLTQPLLPPPPPPHTHTQTLARGRAHTQTYIHIYMDAGARVRHLGHRLRLVAKLFRLVEAFTAILLISWSSSHLPWLAAASFRVLLDHRVVFLLGNLIVVLLFVLFRHETATFPNTAYHHDLLSFTSTTTTPPSSTTSQYLVVPPPPQKEVEFEDKQAVHVQMSARAPPCSRSQSEKIGKRKKSPETPPGNSTLRRCRSENGTGRKKKVEDKEKKDAEEFRRMIEEFIAKQTKFHRDESMSIVVAGDGGGLDGDAGAGGEMVVHSFVKSGPLDEASTTVLK